MDRLHAVGPAAQAAARIAVMMGGWTPEFRRGCGGAKGRALRAAVLALVVAVAACSPVETWRNLTGASKYDPNPATTPNTANLAAGAALPYPNLATVPPPPTRELTEAELQKLTQGLVADRKNARHADQQLRAVPGEPGSPPGPPVPAAAAPAGLALAAVAATPAPSTTAPMAVHTAPPPGGPIAAVGAPAKAAAEGPPTAVASGRRKPGQPPLPGPMESSLTSPQIPETPQPETPETAPPPPRLVAMPPATGAGPAHLPAPPPAVPLPATIPAFQPAPPLPVLAAPTPARTAMTAPAGKKPAPPAPVGTPAAEITFAAGSTSLSDADLAALGKVAALYRQNQAALRVVGYAAVGGGDPLARFRSALDQAQAVAAALAKAGVPHDKIAVEAAPAQGAGGGDRAEVLLLR